MNEQELITHIERAFDRGMGVGVEVGIGDDAAVLSLSSRRVVLTTDALHDGTHFRLDWIEPGTLGARAVEVNLSDLAAMGATPHSLLLSLAAPAPLDEALIKAIIDGFAARAREYRCAVIGGNVARAASLSLTVTAIGTLDPGVPAVRRQGALPGHALFVSGALGGAALGLRFLARGLAGVPEARSAIERFREPRARVTLGRHLPDLASAAIDVSDGLARDLTHLTTASGTGAVVWTDRIPKLVEHDALCALVGVAPLEPILSGGEDYEILFTVPPHSRDRAVALGGTEIGRIEEAGPLQILDPQGQPVTASEKVFEHF